MTRSIFDLSGEVVIITGSSGLLGFEYSKAVIQNHGKVIGIDIVENKNSKYLKAKFPNSFSFIKADITKKLELIDALIKIKEIFNKILKIF